MFTKKLLRVAAIALMVQFYAVQLQAQSQPYINEINYFAKLDSQNAPPSNPILFIGSSSFTNWKNVQDRFPNYSVLNRAFGGSSLPHLLLYANEVIFKYNPKQIVIYCGENDLTGGPHITADSVAIRFKRLYTLIRSQLPKVPIAYVSMKPSPSRTKYMETMQAGNDLIKTYIKKHTKKTKYIDVYHSMLLADGSPMPDIFLSDNLHMNEKGYDIWTPIIKPYLKK